MFRKTTPVIFNLNLLIITEVSFCRGDRIRTCDHLVPNQKRLRFLYVIINQLHILIILAETLLKHC